MGLNEKFFKSASEPPIVPTDNFNTVLYTGTGSGSKIVTGVGFQPDLVWGKAKDSGSLSHILFDVVRGENKQISSDLTDAEVVRASAAYEFDLDGFTVTTAGNLNNPNNFVAWCWKAAGAANTYNVLEGGTVTSDSTASGAGITAGTITNGWEVSANRDAGFSIVKHTAPSSEQNYTIGHGLSQKPDMVILKGKSTAGGWFVWHKDLSQESYYLYLNGTFGESDLTQDTRIWGQQSFTDSVISTRSNYTTQLNQDYIAYCFHSVDGYQRIGSYEGSTSNVTVHTDSNGDGTGTGAFQPRFVLVKNADTGVSNWTLWDSVRGGTNFLQPNNSGTEASGRTLTFNSDGFTINTDAGENGNSNGDTFIYLAIA